MNGMVKFAVIGAAAYAAATYGAPEVIKATGAIAGEYTGDIVPLALAAVAAVVLAKVL